MSRLSRIGVRVKKTLSRVVKIGKKTLQVARVLAPVALKYGAKYGAAIAAGIAEYGPAIEGGLEAAALFL
jgi:hypothetical protein